MEDSCAGAMDPDLLEIVDYSRRRFVRFKLGTHPRQARTALIKWIIHPWRHGSPNRDSPLPPPRR
jgi:hypothetical protein